MLTLIVCRSKNGIIGANGKIPWRLPADLKFFKECTENKVLVMGRKTFESIGNPLPNRITVLVSKTEKYVSDYAYNQPKLLVVTDIEAALHMATWLTTRQDSQEIMVCGGQTIYEALLPRANKVILTTLDCEVEGDCSFPQLDPNEWLVETSSRHSDSSAYLLGKENEKGLSYTIERYGKKLPDMAVRLDLSIPENDNEEEEEEVA